ncbi:MAG: carbohydrate ABC transporter permease [Clostridiales bacterium]|jgi:putative aldouronate transport system permease protein|nr:carbohydrate ABC transporter permease [Clostridiales bacterium]MDR2750328.1 carbohydrate ABC transporter permease [Clostridiales bacterium]
MIKSRGAKIADWIIVFICVIIIFVCLLPIVNIAARSLSSADALMRSKVILWPVEFNVDAYAKILSDVKYTRSLGWTAILTVICTALSMFMTIMCAFPLIYNNLKGKRVFNAMIIFTMYFSAGTIPNYLLLKDLGLLENALVMIIPNCLSVFNMIILRSFFYGIPESLKEAAELEGCGPFRTLINVYLPLSTPTLATLSLFYAVGRWNGFSDALMYITRTKELFPIQLLLYNLLQNMMSIDIATQEGFTMPGVTEGVKAATVMFAIVPILIVYPLLQRYFIAGVTLGGVKG